MEPQTQSAAQDRSEEEVFDDSRHDDLLEYLDTVSSRFTDWIDDIERDARTTVENGDEGDRDNLMYNLPFVKFFKRLCKLLPLWSAVCCDIFNSPYETSSSGNVESDFKNVKLSLKDIIPCRVDLFVERHLQMLDGAVRIASQKYFSYVDNDSESGNERGSILSESDHETNNLAEKSVRLIPDDEYTNSSGCVACNNNHLPSNAHTCCVCGKNVHILSGCSLSIGEKEGFGEKRICMVCSTSTKSTTSSKKHHNETTQPTKELDNERQEKDVVKESRPTRATKSKSTETFSSTRKSVKQPAKSEKKCTFGGVTKTKANELNHTEKWKKKIKRSYYLQPSPHWDLITNVDKKVKIGMLRNGGISKTTHRVNNRTVALQNTCAFDSVVQVSSNYSLTSNQH